MKIILSKAVFDTLQGPFQIQIDERLPSFILSPCTIGYHYKFSKHADYYLLELTLQGEIHISCQRCLGDFKYPYKNKSIVAVCRSEDVAERLMASYDCIVSDTNEVDLSQIITDDIHLYCPEKHAEIYECDATACTYLN